MIFKNSNCEKKYHLYLNWSISYCKTYQKHIFRSFFLVLNQFNCVFLCENSVLSGCDTSSLSYIDWKKSISFFKIVSFCIELSQWSNTYINIVERSYSYLANVQLIPRINACQYLFWICIYKANMSLWLWPVASA